MSKRERIIRWDDPNVGLQQLPTMSGLDYLHAVQDGTLPPPPMSAVMNMSLQHASVGRVVFTCTPDESLYNPIGTVHGGLVCTLLDSVLGCAAHTTLDAGLGYTSIDINVSYLRPITHETGQLTATGEVTKAGRRVIFTTGHVNDPHGNTVAAATSTLLVLAPRAD